MVGHHDLGRGVGQLGPHGLDLGLGRRLLLGEGGSSGDVCVTSVSPAGSGGGEAASFPSFWGKCSPDGVHRLLMLVPYAP